MVDAPLGTNLREQGDLAVLRNAERLRGFHGPQRVSRAVGGRHARLGQIAEDEGDFAVFPPQVFQLVRRDCVLAGEGAPQKAGKRFIRITQSYMW